MLLASAGKKCSALSVRWKDKPFISPLSTMTLTSDTLQLAVLGDSLYLRSMATEETREGKCSPLRIAQAMTDCPGGPGWMASPLMMTALGFSARALSMM